MDEHDELKLRRECDRLREEVKGLVEERKARLKYQEIAYDACNVVDKLLENHPTKGNCVLVDDLAETIRTNLAKKTSHEAVDRLQAENANLRERIPQPGDVLFRQTGEKRRVHKGEWFEAGSDFLLWNNRYETGPDYPIYRRIDIEQSEAPAIDKGGEPAATSQPVGEAGEVFLARECGTDVSLGGAIAAHGNGWWNRSTAEEKLRKLQAFEAMERHHFGVVARSLGDSWHVSTSPFKEQYAEHTAPTLADAVLGLVEKLESND